MAAADCIPELVFHGVDKPVQVQFTVTKETQYVHEQRVANAQFFRLSKKTFGRLDQNSNFVIIACPENLVVDRIEDIDGRGDWIENGHLAGSRWFLRSPLAGC